MLARALAASRAKAAGVRALLSTAGVPAGESAALLASGWKEIERAAGLVAKLEGGDPPDRSGGGASSADLERLREAAAEYVERGTAALQRADCERLLSGLETALLGLEERYIRRLAGSRERLLRRLGRGALLASAAVVTAALGIGLFFAFTTPGAKQGLSATYYVKPDFSGHRFDRIDHGIDFEWEREAPLDGVPAGRFSVRWEGCVLIDEPTRLAAGADGALSVAVDGQKIIEVKGGGGYRVAAAAKAVQPGSHRILIEYAHRGGEARVLLGRTDGGGRSAPDPIPAASLVPRGGNDTHACGSKAGRSAP